MAFDLATAKPVDAPKFDTASAKPLEEPYRLKSADETVQRAILHTGRNVGRQVALTGRYITEGVGNLMATPGALYDAAMDAYDNSRSPSVSELVTGKQPTGIRFRTRQTLDNALSKFLPSPENAQERVAQDVVGGMASAAPFVKGGQILAEGASPLVRKIGEVLSAGPATQVAAGGTGAGSAGATREAGGGPLAQAAAGVAGSFVPSLGTAMAEGVRRLYRGGEAGRQKMLGNIDTFEDAGAGTPSVGQATESRGNRAVESLLAKAPGGAGPMAAKAEEEAAGLGGKVEDIAASVAGRTGAAPAGRSIKSGLEQFVEDFKGQSGKLYDALDQHVPKDTQVGVSNTRAALEKLNADIPGAPNLSKWFKNAKIQGIEGALEKDAPATQAQPIISQILDAEGKNIVTGETPAKAAGIPYEALKKLRTLVGNEMADSTIASDVPRSKWKPLYAALSKDMAEAARTAGPKAEAAFVRANNYHRSGMQRLGDVLDPILAKGDPEDIFKAAVSGTKEGATTINGVMKSLPPESKKVVAGTMLRRLGVATPGKQNDLGEAFSTETFLTNWNKLHPDAKRVLFAPLDSQMRSDLDQVAKVASNIREGSKVFANPSGSGQTATNNMTAGAFALSLLTGQWHTAAGIAGTVGGAWTQAKLMTNPKVVHWLAESTRIPLEQVPAQLNNLFRETLYMKGDDRREVRAFVKDARSALQQTREQQAPAEGAAK